MKTRTLMFPRVSPGIIAASAAALVMAVGIAALVAHADTAPTVTNSIQNGTNAALATAPIGTSVFDVATVASTTSSTAPTGTVDFNVYADTGCSGTPTTQSAVALVNGAATSSDSVVPSTGLSYQTHYSGDDNNVTADSACQALAATAASVSVGTSLSTSTVLAGSSVYDTATLSGETSGATGTVAYTAYTDDLCTANPESAGAETVSGGIVPNSNTLLFNTAGTYYWQAVYSGDEYNSAATSTCTGEVLNVEATSTPVTPPTGPDTISGTVYNDANKNDVQDSGESGLAGWTIWLHLGTLKDGYNNPIVQTATTDGSGNYSFTNLAAGTYFVEEEVQSGWNQTSSDTKVVLADTSSSATVNFANVMKSSIGNGKGTGHCDGDNDADDTGCIASTTPPHGNGNGNGFWGNFWNHFSWGSHFGQQNHNGKNN